MDIEAIEGFAALALREARLDGEEHPDARLLCKRLDIGIVLATRASFIGRNHAQTGRFQGRDIVRIRRGLPPLVERFSILHEVGHIMLARWSVECVDEETIVNGMAGAIAVPRDPLRRVWRRGADLRDVIEAWPNVAPTCCALRVGEARLADAAVTVGRKVIYLRSEQPIASSLLDVADIAARGEVVTRDGLGAYPLTDGTRRAAVVMELAA